ncbi:MAG: DUF2252 family protein, partial [Chthoniobacteraceae bacterium]
MDIIKATRQYEKWLGQRMPLIPADLRLKHERMKESAFMFLRATFYRWCQVWPEICPEAARVMKVLAVGDLHVENFGTWRDAEGRLVWGINDFDEVAHMPFTMDLVRLAVSAHFATEEGHLKITAAQACDAILEGYREGLKAGGKPFVLGEMHHWLRELAMSDLRDPAIFWTKIEALPACRNEPPKGATKALELLLPRTCMEYSLCHRIAGLGSLGRQRYVAVADWDGGKIAREAKRLTVSAYTWARDPKGKMKEIFYQDALDHTVRAKDPYVRLEGRWIVRRLAPDCSRVPLASLP